MLCFVLIFFVSISCYSIGYVPKCILFNPGIAKVLAVEIDVKTPTFAFTKVEWGGVK